MNANEITNNNLNRIIPSDWNVSILNNVAEIIMGQSPVGKSYNRNENGTPLINGPTEFTERYPIKIQWTTEPTKFSKKGDILICVRGSSTGRINISNDEYCIGRGVAAIRAKGNNDHIYLEYQIRNAVKYILSLTTGSTFPNIDGNTLKNIYIPIPPKAEQTAIATALSDVDALIQSLEKLIAKKRLIKQGAMQELLKPKEGWVVKKLGEIGKCYRGVSYNPEYDLFQQDTVNTIRLFRANNVQESYIDYNNIQYVDESRVSEFQKMIENDILICMSSGSRALVGKAALFRQMDSYRYTFGAFMGCFRLFSKDAIAKFVFYNFLTYNYRSYIDLLLSGSSINNLKPNDIESIEISLPKMVLQTFLWVPGESVNPPQWK
jgi:type I restriction enzyme, S subunit